MFDFVVLLLNFKNAILGEYLNPKHNVNLPRCGSLAGKYSIEFAARKEAEANGSNSEECFGIH